jgi:hypothetical protein
MAYRFHWSAYWAAIAGLVLVIAGGGYVLGRMDAPEPKTETITEVHDVPPACREIGPALQAERGTAKELDAAVEAVPQEVTELTAVGLTADEEKILGQVKVLDEAKRDVQRLTLQLATDEAATNAVVADCAPERDQ